jgi:cytosine deaminase
VSDLFLRAARMVSGERVDVRVVEGKIAEIGALQPTPSETVEDLDGLLLLPAMAEPHAHLDKALSAERAPNPKGDLPGAIEAWTAYSPRLTVADMAERAERCARRMLANGTTSIRTHVDVHEGVELRAVHALLEVRARLAGLVDLQIVALMGWPNTGLGGADNQARLRAALDAGVDLVGGCPHLEDDGPASIEHFLATAASYGVGVDLHVDETLDPEMMTLEVLADRVIASGFTGRVAASHCVSLGMRPRAEQDRIAAKVAEASISVFPLPQTNLYLQGRDDPTAVPRGLTAIAALRRAGVTVAAGADNVQDPFNLVGRADGLETAALLVMAGHLSPTDAYDMVSREVRRATGFAGGEIVIGAAAELVALDAESVRDAVATAPPTRTVIHDGRVVSRRRLISN